MNTHPLRRVLANAANRGAICFNDALYRDAVIALLDALCSGVDCGVVCLPPAVRGKLERVRKCEEWV